jgi:DNA repair protein RadA/Sms
MTSSNSYYVCQNCGGEFPKWSGQCGNCGEWNSLVETAISKRAKGSRLKTKKTTIRPVKLSEVREVREGRVRTGISEFDRVLGGGIVSGSVVLIAGEPGIGKSTLLTQLALQVSKGKILRQSGSSLRSRSAQDDKAGLKSVPALSNLKNRKSTVLYVCGEESPAQIRLRIDRIWQTSGKSANEEKLLFLPETDIDAVVTGIEQEKPSLVIVDSVQSVVTRDLRSSAGSVSQISECTRRLIEVAKGLSIPIFLVGHVTKEGSIAGPKVLEHMVDAVLELSGDRQHEFRILRANKNRFGATDEVGIFSMDDAGMKEVTNPSDRFLEDRQKRVPGSSVVCVLEGTRPVLVELQALVVPSQLAVPRRVASGVDQRRVHLLVAVLTKRCGIRLFDKDVYVNVAGGLTIREPASDFGICLAVASSALNKTLPQKAVAIGEVGLLGEVRKVGRLKKRISEAKAQGFNKFVTASEFSSLQKAIRSVIR